MRQFHVMQVAAIGLALATLMSTRAAAEIDMTSELTVDAGLAQSETGGAPRASLRYGMDFQPFGMEIEAARVQDGGASLTTGFVNGVLNLDMSCCDEAIVVPYLLVGVGYAGLDADENRDGMAGQVAIGSKFFVREERDLALHLEGAYQRTEIDGLDDTYSLALGVTWRFE